MDGRGGAESDTGDSASKPERGEVVSQQRLGITINLDELESLMRAYCADSYDGDKGDLQRRLTLSGFVAWVRQRRIEQLRARVYPYGVDNRRRG